MHDLKPSSPSDFVPGEARIMINSSPRDLVGETGIFRVSGKYALREPQFRTDEASGVPVKVEDFQPKDSWEKGSEILFGQVYRIIGISSDATWMKVRLGGYDTEGWIELHQHSPCSSEQFDTISQRSHPMLASARGVVESLSVGERRLPLFLGASLPALDRHQEFEVGGERFRVVEGTPVQGWLRPTISNFLSVVRETLGMPYEWGGKGGAVDCSGETGVVYSFFGLKFPHSARQQSKRGDEVAQFSDSKTGDLIAYGASQNPNSVNHIGILVRDGEEKKLIHASQYVRVNSLDNQGRYSEHVDKVVRAIRRVVNFGES